MCPFNVVAQLSTRVEMQHPGVSGTRAQASDGSLRLSYLDY